MPFFTFDAGGLAMRCQTNRALRAQLEMVTEQCRLLQAENRELLDERAASEVVLEELLEHCGDLAAQHEEADLRAVSLALDVTSLSAQRNELEAALGESVVARRNMSAAMAEMTTDVRRLTRQCDELKANTDSLKARNANQFDRIQTLELEVDEFQTLQYHSGLLAEACDLADQERMASSNRHGRLGTVTIRELMGWDI